MLRAALDESFSEIPDLKGQLFVLAGYVSTIDRWEAFSRVWSNALLSFTNGQPFSMADAARLWSEELQKERVGYLQDVIAEYAEFGVRVSCNPKMLAFYMKDCLDHKMANPHYFCLWFLITHVLVQADDLLLDRKIEFVFDRGQTKPIDLIPHWDGLMANAPANIREQVPNEPMFRSNTEFIPLQAADMTAWWQARRLEERELKLEPRWLRPHRGLGIAYRSWHIDEDFLRKWRDLNILGTPVPYSGPDGHGFLFPGGQKVLVAPFGRKVD